MAPRTAEISAYGLTFVVDPRDQEIGAELLRTGTYEPAETALFVARLHPGMTVIDIGANIGVYSLLAARAVGPTGRVIAFEPAPRTAELLRRNVLLNGGANVRVEQLAVGRSSREAELFIVEKHSGLASLSSFNARSSSLSVPVSVVTLDEYCRDMSVDLIKMDAQGAEAEIAAGALGVIDRCRPVVFAELWPAALESLGSDGRSFLTLFAERDYELATVDEPERRLSPDEILERTADTGGTDLVLVPPEKRR